MTATQNTQAGGRDMGNIIHLHRSLADSARLYNRQFDIEAQHEPAPVPSTSVTPTPLGWFLIGIGMLVAVGATR
jgi:hypothetical protein